ncbi:GNAT family N-acetyltransferase [Lachnoclostridium phytofermentans]|uniref:GCN5-related N-acetyltransferase n=1 Tax=Lachnoclostridium phytofermentans (strain ATCC 700394 / DSM 18823 / ISDg) TaxID=357809 RepID=A9KLY9_LACP7|nr:GNAT family N-acetyltransferase [Lachnoclostridium phytofermentans]ABX41332.1 GCN5-related N-acetyltransferase [Lachnoclostridium phytofermentans ISDg]
MDLRFEKGTLQDVDELERLYDDLNDFLACHTNYPGWKKNIYPNRDTAVEGIEEGNLFVARTEGKIVGTVILRHRPESAYALVNWHTDLDYSEIFVIYTLAVHPEYLNKHVGKQIMDFVITYAEQMQMKALRLDVYQKNIPAIRLYESCDFQYIDTVDLGLSEYGLDLFKLYQRIL